jgi:hypothetical protein
MVEHRGIAPCIPVWKTGVYLSTPMLEMGKWLAEPELAPGNQDACLRTGVLRCGSAPRLRRRERRLESRTRLARAWAFLQTAACADRPTG